MSSKKEGVLIDLVDSDDSELSTDDRKRPQQADEDAMPPAKRADIKRTFARECPIKLLATWEDMENRQKHSSVEEMTSHPCWTQCKTLRELLGFEEGGDSPAISWLVVCNYLIDYAFLLNEVPEFLSVPCTTVFYDAKNNPMGSHAIWQKAATQGATEFVPLTSPDRWGVHHSKIFLVGRADHLRVVIHTSNLLLGDNHRKAQAAYFQDFPLKETACKDNVGAESSGDTNSSTAFEEDLVAYFETYGYKTQREWAKDTKETLLQCLRRYDYSSAQVVLLPSTPGYHQLNGKLQGHLKLRQAISQHCRAPAAKLSSPMPVVCQFSSIGSLSERYLQELYASMDVVSATRPKTERPGPQTPLASKLRLVYPTKEEICNSVEGMEGGGSVPGTSKNVNKAFLRPLYHKWSSLVHYPLAKPRNVPHIKTYYQIGPDASPPCMEWFAVSSHNLSKAAWGEVQNTRNGRRLFVRHWELGVWLCPQLMGSEKLVPWSAQVAQEPSTDSSFATVPLPYAFFPQRYGTQDKAWTVDSLF